MLTLCWTPWNQNKPKPRTVEVAPAKIEIIEDARKNLNNYENSSATEYSTLLKASLHYSVPKTFTFLSLTFNPPSGGR